MAKIISKKPRKIEIKDLSESARKDLGKGQLRKITGGRVFTCPGDCDRLDVSFPDTTVLQVKAVKRSVSALKTPSR